MRNFHRGYKHENSSRFSSSDRNRYRPNDGYRRDNADKGFNRSFSERKPRRDFENSGRSSFNKDGRDGFGGNRSYGDTYRSLPERSYRKPDQRFQNTSPRSDREIHGRFNRNETRIRRSPSPAPRDEFPVSLRGRPSRGAPVRRGQTSGVLRRTHNDLRTSLISKRSAPTNRSKEYIKKIKQARLRINDSFTKQRDDSKTPPRDETDEKHDDEAEILDVANDINFDDEDEEKRSEKDIKKNDETDKASLDKASTSRSTPEKRSKKNDPERKDLNDEDDDSYDLKCTSCQVRCSSLNDFRLHLTRRIHLIAMRKVSIKLRMTLNRLRKVQRDRQLEIEARLKNVEEIPSKYCQICKLYFRQSKIEHRESDDHKKIRNFLKPHCKFCRVQLLSAMKFEIHKCTIGHLKQKARKHEASDDIDLQEFNLDDFKTLDSVGECEIDGEEELEDDKEENELSTALGQDFVTKVEVNYCSLCREYLLRSSNDEKAISDHCKSKKHLKWYYQSKKKDEPFEEKSSGDVSLEAKNGDVSTASMEVEEESSIVEDEDKGETEMKESENEDSTAQVDEASLTQEESLEENEKSSKKFTRYFEEV